MRDAQQVLYEKCEVIHQQQTRIDKLENELRAVKRERDEAVVMLSKFQRTWDRLAQVKRIIETLDFV